MAIPFSFNHSGTGWLGGVGEIALGWKRVLFSNVHSGSILGVQGEVALPTGNRARGFGSGTTTFGTFASFGQSLPANSFLQVQGGADLPVNPDKSPQSVFLRTALGKSFSDNHALGRMWSPIIEAVASRNLMNGATTDWDVLPQFQITVSRRQHIRADLGVRVPSRTRRTTGSVNDVFPVGSSGWRFIRGMEVKIRCLVTILMACAPIPAASAGAHRKHDSTFQTSDRCIACHVGLIMPSGKDVSIGTDWQSSIMANSSRDPYWQASVRRESIDHPELQRTIEDECSICHMPIARFEARQQGGQGEVFTHLPLDSDDPADRQAADGVSCSVCHQISKEKLGTRESFNGGFVIDKPESKGARPEYGPFDIEKGQTRIMQTSTGGFQPNDRKHIQQSELCATCHTLYTKSLGARGKELGVFPEQMPYPEWQHSDFATNRAASDATCRW